MAASTEEQILRSYCPPSLSVEYDQMSLSGKKSLREALLTTVRMKVMNMMPNDHSNPQLMMMDDSNNTPDHRLGGLLKDLLHMTPPSNVVECIQHILSKWGAISSSILQYQQVVFAHRSQYTRLEQDKDKGHFLNTSSVVSKRQTKAANWKHQLRKISFTDLVLFQTAAGCYIEGKIVGEPIQPMVGGTTLIQDPLTKRVLLVCFYNVLPDGIHGSAAEQLLQQEFPMGATLRVAEPFYKIFGDGQRGVRVDTPNELYVVRGDPSSSSSASSFKEAGNDFVKQKKYMAAVDLYLKGLRSSSESDFVATILSNRSQANILLENHWCEALCDAAASLTIRPNSIKTWARYRKCLSRWQEDDAPPAASKTTTTKDGLNKKELMSKVIESALPLPIESTTVQKIVDMKKAQILKKEGNDAFQKQSYVEAIALYSNALQACGETTRAILSNWALCALEMHNLGDVIASSIASLRIGYDDKPIYRLIKALSHLGNYDLAKQALCLLSSSAEPHPATIPKQFNDLQDQLTRCVHYQKNIIRGKADSPLDAYELLNNTPPFMGNWIHESLETFSTRNKGRGLRTTKDLPVGSVVLVEWALVNEVLDLEHQGKKFVISNTDISRVEMGSSAQLRSIVVNRLKREALLSQIMSHMSDGEHTPGLVHTSELLVNLEMFHFLLPTHRDYYNIDGNDDGKEKASFDEITADRVDKILDINCHGTTASESNIKCETQLYPTLSMMNHESDPNCAIANCSLKHLSIIVTREPVRAGEELTIKYQSDEVVESKWGIKKKS